MTRIRSFMHFYDHNHEEYENIASSENFSNIMRFRCMHWTDTILPKAKHTHTHFSVGFDGFRTMMWNMKWSKYEIQWNLVNKVSSMVWLRRGPNQISCMKWSLFKAPLRSRKNRCLMLFPMSLHFSTHLNHPQYLSLKSCYKKHINNSWVGGRVISSHFSLLETSKISSSLQPWTSNSFFRFEEKHKKKFSTNIEDWLQMNRQT